MKPTLFPMKSGFMNRQSIFSLAKLPTKITFITRSLDVSGLHVVIHSLLGGGLVATHFTDKTSGRLLNQVKSGAWSKKIVINFTEKLNNFSNSELCVLGVCGTEEHFWSCKTYYRHHSNSQDTQRGLLQCVLKY